MAEDHKSEVEGLVLVSGYYFWTLRPDALLVAPGATPLLGRLLSHTVTPFLGWLQMPLLKRAMFAPAPVSRRFQAEYSPALALRPSQIQATSMDGALMIQRALALRGRYRELTLPVVIIAGEGDKVVFKRRSEQLRDNIPGAVLQIVEGAGHMVHYNVPSLIAQAVERVSGAGIGPADEDQFGTHPQLDRDAVEASLLNPA